MRIFYGFDHLPRFEHPAATVGSYDGVHGGHLTLLDTVIRTAHERQGESIVLTFEPHPRVTLGSAEDLRLLTTTEEKALLLERAGIDNLIIIPFDKAFSQLTPSEFVYDYLIGKLGVETLVVGYNHRFGHDNEGSGELLDTLRRDFGFNVLRISEYDVDSGKVSSTVLRRLIERGEMAQASRLMPHPYLLIGDAKDGTIHVSEPLKLLPPTGEYRVVACDRVLTLTILADGTLKTSDPLPEGKVVLTFEL